MNEAQARQTSADEKAANIKPDPNRDPARDTDPFDVDIDPYEAMNESDRSARVGDQRSESRHRTRGRSRLLDKLGMHDDEQADLDEQDYDDEDEIRQRAVQLLSRVRRRIREQPLRAAGGAFILGFAFGNGVPKFLARAGIAIGLRVVMQRMFERSELLEADA